jgi:hypothetical protein
MAAMADTAGAAAAEARLRAFVHIGAPKTGTTYVQSVLWANREQLATDGVLYPYEHERQHFPAMLDLRERGWGGHPPGYWRGTWDSVAERASTWTGHTSILGNEILGGASKAQVRRLVDSLSPAEVHVIFTARDLARQLVSDWQEHIKHKHTVTLEEFVDDLIQHGHDAQPPFGEMFWGLHDADHVLRRWSQVVPAHRIHLVTLPPPGAARAGTLWERYCQVTGLDPGRYSLDVKRTNTSLGRAEAEVVRQVNTRVGEVSPQHYDPLVRTRLTGSALNGSGGRIVLPEGRMPWVQERSRSLVDALSGSGYDIVGDLDDLMPRPEDHQGYVATHDIKAADMLPVAIRTTAALLRIAATQRSRIREYRRELGELPPHPSESTPEARSGAGGGAGSQVRWRARQALAAARARLRPR